MITGELKSKVDRIWDTMWSGGISNPLSVIEQLTYLLFIKRLDELHTREEHKAARTGHPIEEPLFTPRQAALRWSRFKELAPERMFETVRDRVFPFIKSLGQTGDPDEGSTYTHHMKDALFMMPTARGLANVVDQLDDIDMADRDTKGDLYEYMLGKIATAGQNGQFRTPRHIIRLMVDMTAPTPKDVICDPACGTAGFLVAASEHLVEHHGDRIYKNARARRRFNEGTFHGYDFDTTMLRIGSMNMLLHGVENPDIRYRDSLAQTDLAAAADDAERYSLVLANPPFGAVSTTSPPPRTCSRSSRRRRPSCCSWPCSCACSRPAAAPPSSCPTAYSSGPATRTGPCAGFSSRSRSSTPSSPCPPASSNPTPGSPPASCSSPRPTPAARTTSAIVETLHAALVVFKEIAPQLEAAVGIGMDTAQRFKIRIERLLAKGGAVLETDSPNPRGVIGFPTLDHGIFTEWRAQSLSLLTNLLGAEHVYVTNFEREVGQGYTSSVKAGIGILKAVLQDIEDGSLTDVRTLVSAEVFTDFLDMAGHLLEHGYKDPAASLCGAVLEDGLRRIATNKGINVRKRDDLSVLNQKLATTGVYTRLVQKRLAVWTDVRNAADHGRFSEYSEADVADMHTGVSSFLAQHLT